LMSCRGSDGERRSMDHTPEGQLQR